MIIDAQTPGEQVGVLIKQAQALLNQRMDEVLRPLGLTVSQYACLQTLHDDPGITGSELARRVFVSRQSTNVLLQSLEKRGLVERSEDPGPRRERATLLTDEAVVLTSEARAAVAEVVATMTGPLQRGDLEQLRALLAACRDALA
ncbi:MarR family transcriptional regulator [Microbacterium horticulturae]|uniref:MarR family transcriptional regulator n=1 Tax=Microbacterium horticulturae TaxID=3028316 RepID=A0ABY8C0W3_9MICO|nr:MarR family transcriptional regulator [Microbacterium sp. KACC 23027]WEG09762.1 MarR family transcriptional regulator [Microbacterium sp. KACC 23027]